MNNTSNQDNSQAKQEAPVKTEDLNNRSGKPDETPVETHYGQEAEKPAADGSRGKPATPLPDGSLPVPEKKSKGGYKWGGKRKVKKQIRKQVPHVTWSEDEDDLLKKVYPHMFKEEIQKLFPNRTGEAIDARASQLGLKKTPEVLSAIQARNPMKHGLSGFADYPLQALTKNYPQLQEIYDSVLENLLKDPAVDPNNLMMVELLKEAVLHKIAQYILMADRINAGFKGRMLFVNPKTGFEQWVEAKYPHSGDIAADAKLARQILKDLNILKEPDKKVDVNGSLRLLWEDDTTGDRT